MKTLSTLLFCIVAVSFAFAQQKPIKDDCTCVTRNGKTIKLYGRVQVVDAFEDFRVQKVENFPDLKVKVVENFPDACGKWQLVDKFPDFKIRFVDNFSDFKIQFVDNFPDLYPSR